MKSVAVIDVFSPSIDWKWACPDVERLARYTAREALICGMSAIGLASPAGVELGIMLTDDAQQRKLNRNYRGRDISTNVLAFPAWKPGTPAASGAPLLLGDLVLAFETVVREADEQCKPLADHLRHLIVHGVLHLLGFDHRTEVEAAMMERLEKLILAKLGVPDPYRDIMSSTEPEPIYP
jgi:probable rRNA maturation factor